VLQPWRIWPVEERDDVRSQGRLWDFCSFEIWQGARNLPVSRGRSVMRQQTYGLNVSNNSVENTASQGKFACLA